MFSKEKTLTKILAFFLIILIGINPLAVPVAWAAEDGQEPPSEEQGEPFDEAQGEPPAEEESSSGGDSTITTGEAEAQATVETTVNTHIVCLAGQVSTPESPCDPPEIEVETDCPDGVQIANDNLADVSDTATSSATTGDNEILGVSGDALIETGNATAGASLENEVNTNVVILEDSNAQGRVLAVENENEVTATNSADVLADTGENQASENGGEATIETGNALAFANLINLLNTNIVGSDFEIYLRHLLDQEEDIDFNALWQELVENGELEGLSLEDREALNSFLIQNSNAATLENEVTVAAETGTNEANQNQEGTFIHTGDATALANVINLVNLNLVGSKFFLGVINIFGSFLGDLILPRPEKFTNSDVSVENANGGNSDLNPVTFENQNSAEINDSVVATAETGNNEENNNQGDNFIQTGNATSQANAFSLVNTNIRFNDWFLLIINHLGSWMGMIFGWSAPGAVEAPTGNGPTLFQIGADSQGGEEFSEGEGLREEEMPGGVVQNQNQAQIKNKIDVSASTGQNQANENGGDTEIITGKATALANLFNLVNLNILGSRWFLGVINILGDWSGNTIFAYPDVVVALTNGIGEAMPGEITDYTLVYQNQGYDEASNVWLQFELPEGVNFLGDSSGLTPQADGQIYSWFLGNLDVGEGGSFTIEVQVDSDFSFDEPQLSFWSKIIPQVQAAENGAEKEVVALASIGTADPEPDLTNNTASVRTLVYSSLPEEDEETGGEPRLEISAWNNVGEFVYPGDIVTFEIIIENTGQGSSYDTYLIQELFNGLPEEDFGTAEFEIGTLEPGEGGTLSFGLKLNGEHVLPAGDYHTEAQAFGSDSEGNEVSSNQARTDFKIKSKEIASLFEARAKEEEGEILSAFCSDGQQNEDLLPYILLFLLSSFYLLEKSKELRKVQPSS